MTLLLTGLKAMLSMASEGIRSVVVVQVGVAAVKSGVCQTPPLTLAASRCLAFVGSTAIALIAPTAIPSTPPTVIGAGPSGNQFGIPDRATESRVRSSNGSSHRRLGARDFLGLAAERPPCEKLPASDGRRRT